MRVAVVGAGLAGMSCARVLHEAGHEVRCFDKARKAGGRISSRRGGGLRFDHGAQYFTVRDEAFAGEVERWRQAGVAARWEGRIVVVRSRSIEPAARGSQRWVGTPTMSAIARHLAEPLQVLARTRVGGLERLAQGWRVHDEAGQALGDFEAAVVATPAAQAAPLLASAPGLRRAVESVVMEPCWAVMLHLSEALPLEAEGLFVHDSPLAWAARDGSKPGRAEPNTWVLHATPAWTRAHWSDAPQAVVSALVAALEEAAAVTVPPATHTDVQRWRYARADAPRPEPFLLDEAQRLGVCGDWCGGPRVEGAWKSGRALGLRLL